MRKSKEIVVDEKEAEYIRNLMMRKPVDDNKELADKIAELSETLQLYEEYKNYDAELAVADARLSKAEKAFDRWATNRRSGKYLVAELKRAILVGRHKANTLEELENKLKEFESLIDRKYWNKVTLFFVEMELRLGASNSVEQAVRHVEKD